MSISEVPPEVLIEIFKFSSCYLILSTDLSLVCKEWNNAINSESFYEFLYSSYFGWRNNVINNNNINYQSLLKTELKFWNSWKFHSMPEEFETSINVNHKNQRLLQTKRLTTLDKRNIITEPIFYNTGSYYFEAKCLQRNKNLDNIFVGFIRHPLSNDLNTINFDRYLGASYNPGSFGLYFPDGDVYGLKKVNEDMDPDNMRYVNQEISDHTKVGIYLDTNNLLVRFVLVKEKVIFEMLSLKLFMHEEELQSFIEGKVVLYPAISILYEKGIMEINSTAGFRSIKKAKWIKNFVTKK